MGRRDITHACGHVETAQLYGSSWQRGSRARWLAESECGTCWTARRDLERVEQSERSAAANQTAGLPALEGSPKQVAWAETIRADIHDELTTRLTELLEVEAAGGGAEVREKWARRLEHIRTVLAALPDIASARWYIDHRDHGMNGLVRMAEQGRISPRTAAQRRSGFDPFGLNTLVFPAGEVAGRTADGRCVRLRLVHSRWEGCTVDHPVSMMDEAPDGKVTIRFGGEWTIPLHDGARTRFASAEDFHLDRVNRREEPGERRYWGPPSYVPGEWNEVDVPEGEVSEREGEGKHLAVVHLVCSRWEGLYFNHPVHLLRRHRPGFVTVRFGPQQTFKVLGGERMLHVSGQAMYQDRSAPLPQPGESLAVEQKTWHAVTFHPSWMRRGKRAWWVRLPLSTAWPDSCIFHEDRWCRCDEDGYVTWRFPEDWTFRVRTPASGTVAVSAAEFLEATSGWAKRMPEPGTYTREPEELEAEEVTIPAELLEDDPFIAEED